MYNLYMSKLEEAYKIIDSIPRDATRKEAYEYAKKAFEVSNECYEAIVIMSRCLDTFSEREKVLIDNIDNCDNKFEISYELGSIYYEYGMFRKALNIFGSLYQEKKEIRFVYRLLNIYSLFEDDKIESLYNECIKDKKDDEYVRLTFPYLVYKYKNAQLDEVNKLLKEINSINPYITKILQNKIDKDNNEKVSEAYRVIRNNSLLINSCVDLVNYLVSIC